MTAQFFLRFGRLTPVTRRSPLALGVLIAHILGLYAIRTNDARVRSRPRNGILSTTRPGLMEEYTMIDIWVQGHTQTIHNAAGLVSGHYDIALTEAGREQARSVLRRQYAHEPFDVVFTSDTQRAYETACLIFEGLAIPICQDARLRECDYGDLTGCPRVAMEVVRPDALFTPFPHGESYQQVAERMYQFLVQLAMERDHQQVLLVGHMATVWMCEYWLQGRSLAEAVGSAPARPWRYALEPHTWYQQVRTRRAESARDDA